MADTSVRTISRQLWDLIEPIASCVYFVPEAHAAYGELGLPGFGGGYFCSRAACMGQVPGEVVVATFAVFNPDIVLPAVEEGWSKTDAPTILAARQRGATEGLTRMLGADVDRTKLERATEIMARAAATAPMTGRPLFAGLRSLGFPGDPVGDLWRAADLLREHRGDSHVAAWTAYGLGPIEINLLTELWWNIRLHSYVKTRGWTEDQITAAIERMRQRGLIDGDAFTKEGEELRAAVEDATDRGETDVVEAIGDDADELFELLRPWTQAVLEAKGYPRDPALTTRK